MRLERRVRLDPLEQRVRRVRRVRLEALDRLEQLERRVRLEPLGRLARLARLDPRDPLESLTTARLLGHCVLATGGRFRMKDLLLCSETLKPQATVGMQCSLRRATRTSRD